MLGWKGGGGRRRYLGKNIGLNAGLVSGEGLTHEVTESEKTALFSCFQSLQNWYTYIRQSSR